MAKNREQTTAERAAMRQEARQREERSIAAEVLRTLGNARHHIGGFPTKEARKIVEELNDRIAWLLRENEAYTAVAADNWLTGQQGADGSNDCSQANLSSWES